MIYLKYTVLAAIFLIACVKAYQGSIEMLMALCLICGTTIYKDLSKSE